MKAVVACSVAGHMCSELRYAQALGHSLKFHIPCDLSGAGSPAGRWALSTCVYICSSAHLSCSVCAVSVSNIGCKTA